MEYNKPSDFIATLQGNSLMPRYQNGPTLLDAPPLISDPAFALTDFAKHLDASFLVEDDTQVQQFLSTHPDIFPLLTNALPELRRVFGPQVAIRLWVLSDGESEARLDARVLTDLGLAQARAARAQFFRTWWTRQTEAREYLLTFGIELLH